MAEEFCHIPHYPRKKMVTCIGHQPGSSAWVFGPDIQLDNKGEIIPKDQQEYYWYVECTAWSDIYVANILYI